MSCLWWQVCILRCWCDANRQIILDTVLGVFSSLYGWPRLATGKSYYDLLAWISVWNHGLTFGHCIGTTHRGEYLTGKQVMLPLISGFNSRDQLVGFQRLPLKLENHWTCCRHVSNLVSTHPFSYVHFCISWPYICSHLYIPWFDILGLVYLIN